MQMAVLQDSFANDSLLYAVNHEKRPTEKDKKRLIESLRVIKLKNRLDLKKVTLLFWKALGGLQKPPRK